MITQMDHVNTDKATDRTLLEHRSTQRPVLQNSSSTKAVKRSYNKTFFSKIPKVFAEFRKVFNFEKFVIYVLPKFS